MSQLYGRTVQVTVGVRGQPGTLVEKLRTTFKIEKNLEKTPNNSIIEIYNLSAHTRALFEAKNMAVRVTAGYGDQAKDIFIGDIATVVTKRTGADIITSIEAGDGLLAYQNQEADLSFAPGAKVGSVLDQLIGSFGLIKGEVQGLDLSSTYLNGVSFSGKVHNHLDTLVGKTQGLGWSIQDGQIQILPKKAGTTVPAVLLSPSTGLVGSPFKRVVLNQDIAKKTDGRDAENGVQVKSLLNPDLNPGRLIVVQAQFVSGTFKILKVVHEGDTHGKTYYSDVEALAI